MKLNPSTVQIYPFGNHKPGEDWNNGPWKIMRTVRVMPEYGPDWLAPVEIGTLELARDEAGCQLYKATSGVTGKVKYFDHQDWAQMWIAGQYVEGYDVVVRKELPNNG